LKPAHLRQWPRVRLRRRCRIFADSKHLVVDGKDRELKEVVPMLNKMWRT